MPDHADIAIVGAGAAGLFAAVFAGQEAPTGARVVALDGAKRLGAKILIAGGGRCNVTHDVVRPEDYAGGSRHAVKKVLRSFSVEETAAWFAAEGVTLKREDTGKLFPTTDKARTVLDALTGAAERAGAELCPGCRVTGLARRDNGFDVGYTRHKQPHTLNARRVVLATGGLALPHTGSDGFGYTLARQLGHTVTPTWPALVPLLLEDGHWATRLSGLSAEAVLELREPSGKRLHQQAGPVLFTHFGLSGPAPMDISRHVLAHRERGAVLIANLRPGETFDTTDRALLHATETQPKATATAALQTWLPERLARALLEQQLGLDPTTPLAQLRRDDRRALAHTLVALPLPVVGDRGFKHAEVTAGGVPLDEVEPATMASRRCPRLHLCGELLDVDGRIGGYNFQWAWCTGRLAGLAVARALRDDQTTASRRPGPSTPA